MKNNPTHYTFANIVKVSPGEIGHIARYDLYENYCIPLHDHDFFEVQYGCAGKAMQYLNGTYSPFLANEFYMMRPEDVHSIRAQPGQHFIYYNMAFETKRLSALCETYQLAIAHQWLNNPNWCRKIVFSPVDRLSVRKGLQEMVCDSKRAFAVDRFLINLLYTLERHLSTPYVSCPDWLQQSIAHLDDVKWLQMGPRALEKISGYSLEYIGRILKKHTGMLPRDVLNQVRMEHAALELTMDAKSIGDIIKECGFENTSHFFRLFKRSYGCTPRQYRQRIF